MRREVLSEVKEDIKTHTYEILQGMMKDIYDNEKITVGGGWNEDTKEYSLREYTIQQVVAAITKDKCDEGWHNGFKEWFTRECVTKSVTPAIEREITKNIDDVRRAVNGRVKDIFETTTKDMLSDTVIKTLMSNDTYQKIQNNIACIADRSSDTEDADCVPSIPDGVKLERNKVTKKRI